MVFMYKKENIENIVKALLSGETCCEEVSEGFIIAYRFNVSPLSQDEINLLNSCMTGEKKEDVFYHWMADVEEKTIVFSEKDFAYETLKQQLPHLEKRLVFSAFQETGILYEREKTGTVQFFKKRG